MSAALDNASIPEAYRKRYRIRRLGTNWYALERKFLWFWIGVSDYNWYCSEEDALNVLKKWAADEAVRGQIVWP
jgi:hypothetical protein